MTIVLATNNAHKVEELQQMLQGKILIKTLKEINFNEEIEETGSTFLENSIIKAKAIYDKFGVNVIADDSGLEIDALNMQPGVYSARYAGQPTNHQANMDKVLAEMTNVANRVARFKTVITLIFNQKMYHFEGTVEGKITTECQGEGGFGYDPIFVPDGYSQTFGELSSETKNQISHRGRAIQKMLEFLQIL